MTQWFCILIFNDMTYHPGHVMIFLSGQVYHYVAKWRSAPSLGSSLTSGRIGNVFFSLKQPTRNSRESLTNKISIILLSL